MKVVGLFAGIGGIEYGFHKSGVDTVLLSEIMPEARCVLASHFQKTIFNEDVTKMDVLPSCNILTAGFPCQNISIAGNKQGIHGEKSSLVHEIFRLIESSSTKPEFIIIENVANIISLGGGEALRLITDKMKSYGYNWAYRLVDPRSFGIPQRRPRFIFVASRIVHPKDLLFPKNEDVLAEIDDKPSLDKLNTGAYGFYWTEGKIGIGWAKDSIPPLKCGSTLGLPSSPAVWDIDNDFFGTPEITDAERLQGFPADWSKPIEIEGFKSSFRWKVIGNAVNTKVSTWLGERISCHIGEELSEDRLYRTNLKPWPKAATNIGNNIMGVKASFYPEGINYTPIMNFLENPLKPLSLKATLGFRKRVLESTLIKYPEQFITSINNYLKNQYEYGDN